MEGGAAFNEGRISVGDRLVAVKEGDIKILFMIDNIFLIFLIFNN